MMMMMTMMMMMIIITINIIIRIIIIPKTKGGTTERGFLLALYRITFVHQDLPSPPGYLDT